MQKENKVYNITPANRVGSVQEYYFSRKLKEVPIFPLRSRQSRHCVNMLVSRTNMVISRM